MKRTSGSTSPLTQDFRHELKTETANRLRNRLLWFIGAWGAVRALYFLWMGAAALQAFGAARRTIQAGEEGAPAELPLAPTVFSASILLAWIAVYAWAAMTIWRRRLARERLLQLSQWLVVLDGVLFALDARFGVDAAWAGWFGILLVHTVACSMLPWTPTQALAAVGSALAVSAVLIFAGPGTLDQKLGYTLALALVAIPGTFVATVRHSIFLKRFRFRHLNTRYHQIRRELVDARRIHESLFPAPIRDGPVHLAYLYEPMRQIGGDFLFAHRPRRQDGRPPPLSVVLLDVTGHGIAAALTVNRVHGELERVFAEQPDIPPGDVATLLNRYVHLTLARHSIYATALCIRVDPHSHIVEYANAGHPPAFLRAVNGNIEELASTALVLGAVPAPDFRPEPRTLPFTPGDTILAYTDGAIEARNADGRLFGIRGVQRVLARAQPASGPDWPDRLLQEVTRFRDGPPEDDTVIIELRHQLEPAPNAENRHNLASAPH